MKTTGITRRIDELGRIVIPKELRKNLHIKNGEMLEIFLNNQDEIILKKYSRVKNDYPFIQLFLKNISKKIDCDIFFTDLSNILISTDDKLNGELLSNNFEDVISSRNISFSNIKVLDITDNYKIYKPFDVYLVSTNGDLFGFIIYKYKKELTNDQRDFIKFSSEFLENYLEEN